MSSESILIVGAGIFGASTAYHLSQSHPSPSITVVDRTPYLPDAPLPAASHDINKIIRTDYTSPFYMDLAYEALKQWETEPWLSRPDGSRYFHRTGRMTMEEKGSDMMARIQAAYEGRGGIPLQDVGFEDVRTRWKGVLGSIDEKGFDGAVVNPETGWADAGEATGRAMQLAVEKGVQYLCGEVEGLVLGKQGVEGVRLKTGEVRRADKILLATGAWTSALLTGTEDDLDIKDKDRVESQVMAAGVAVAHYKLSDDEMSNLSELPVVVYGGFGEVLPAPTQNKLLKFTNATSFKNTVSTASGHKISVPPNRDQKIVPKRLKDETKSIIVGRTIPEFADRKADYWRLCWDAITPDQNWLLTRHPHPRLQNLFLAVGGSFHSYKFLPNAGKYTVNVLEGVSNGEEKDTAWAWKKGEALGRGAHEKLLPRRELGDLEDGETARL